MVRVSSGGYLTLRAVADTHAVIWYLFDDPQLSPRAREFITVASSGGDQIGFSSITLAEIIYLTEKGRIPANRFVMLLNATDSQAAVLAELPFDRYVAEAMRRVDRSEVPDLPDRIIAATALLWGVPVISRDRKIRLSSVSTLW